MLSIVLPAKNEAAVIRTVIDKLVRLYPQAEIIVVNDGSIDGTAQIASEAGARVVSHLESMGNGAAIKTGARSAKGDILVFMDADGQHRPEDVQVLLEKLEQGFDMVVGARQSKAQASMARGLGNAFYNWLASAVVGHKIQDLTSGMRAVKAEKFRLFLSLLPNKFSYPTTITMAFFRAGYQVAYKDIEVQKRVGQSHLNVFKDGARFLIIIFKIGTLYSPLKIFLPVALAQFLLGAGYYLFTFVTEGRFTNMSALMLTTSVTTFLMGLVSEQITTLTYSRRDDH